MSFLGHAITRSSSRFVVGRNINHTITTRIIRPSLYNALWHRSSTTNSNNDSAPQQQDAPQQLDPKQQQLARTLYRQLLRWCQVTGDDIPLAPFMEPVDVQPPQVDEAQLKALQQYRDAKTTTTTSTIDQHQQQHNDDRMLQFVHQILLPLNCRIDAEHLIVFVNNASDVKHLLRAVYRLNNNNNSTQTAVDHPAAEALLKKRVTFAFQTLRTLNELSAALDDLNEHRQTHMDRGEDVKFYVGQVVQHKLERWRGVVVGWEQPEPTTNKNNDQEDDDTNTIMGDDKEESSSSGASLTSLTTKMYSEDDYVKSVRYEVILDAGDIHLLQASSPVMVVTQTDIELLEDTRYVRRSLYAPMQKNCWLLVRLNFDIKTKNAGRLHNIGWGFSPLTAFLFFFSAQLVSNTFQHAWRTCASLRRRNKLLYSKRIVSL